MNIFITYILIICYFLRISILIVTVILNFTSVLHKHAPKPYPKVSKMVTIIQNAIKKVIVLISIRARAVQYITYDKTIATWLLSQSILPAQPW